MATPPPPPPPGASSRIPEPPDAEPDRRWKTWQAATAAGVALLLGIGMGASGSDPVDDTAVLEAEQATERADDLEDEIASLESRLRERDAEVAALEEAQEAAQAELLLATAPAWTVTRLIDGDTLEVEAADGTQETIRVIGIDTPERGECGFGPATSALRALVLNEPVELVEGAQDDRDRYGRLLRYVEVDGVDAGLTLIEEGLAIARYDSRDGYGEHPREAAYIAADEAAENFSCPEPAPEPEPEPEPEPAPAPAPAPPPPSAGGTGSMPDGTFKNCTEARERGAAPVHRGDPGYHSRLDRDGDGVGCE